MDPTAESSPLLPETSHKKTSQGDLQGDRVLSNLTTTVAATRQRQALMYLWRPLGCRVKELRATDAEGISSLTKLPIRGFSQRQPIFAFLASLEALLGKGARFHSPVRLLT